MEFRQIRYALSVAKERSFTGAAKRLNISQSAVSEQVHSLEQEIGFSLFRRTPRGIELTEPGRTFLYEAERVAGDVLSLSDTARRLKGAPSETLVIAMGSGMAQIFIPRLFRKPILPGVRLDIRTVPTKTIFDDLHEERLDAGIAIESDPDRVPGGLVYDRLTDAQMALITHPKHALARSRRAVDVGRLVAEPVIMSELTVGYGQVVLSMFADLGIRPNIVAVADNIETMKVIVQSGRGIAIVPRACVENEVALGGAQSAGDRADAQRDAQPAPPPPAVVAEEGGLSQCRPRGLEGLSAARRWLPQGSKISAGRMLFVVDYI